ncbi:MAG: peptidoglycan synthetase [bacterium]|nr:MAG: peptidoglycan synthetase [bacterium]
MRIHFIAIGGSAMHNLAIALKINGHEITGSDDEIFEPSRGRLKKYGLLPETDGWHPEMISNDLDAIILGMHARPDNPELLRAQETGAKIYSYPEFLYAHAKNKKRVVIGGSHGKTTITAMIMHVLKYWNKDFDYLVGSKLKDFEVMVRLSNTAPVMIFEGDEYLSSPVDRRPKFHWYHPHLALLSGIAWDHINVFPTCENYLEQFSVFIDLMEKKGTLIYNAEDDTLRDLITKSTNDIQKIPYQTPDFEIIGGTSYVFDEKSKIPLKIFGRHNLLNLNGARLVCNELGLTNDQFFEAISGFKGAAKRLELIAQQGGGRLYSDFAHAPSKLKATLNAVKSQFSGQRVLACFELHTFSSLNSHFLDQYAGTMDKADRALVYFNPHALKMKRLPMLDKEQVKKAFGRDDLLVFDDAGEMTDWLKTNSTPEDVFLMMSSGNFDGIEMKTLAMRLLE